MKYTSNFQVKIVSVPIFQYNTIYFIIIICFAHLQPILFL